MSEEISNLTTVRKRAKSFNPFDNLIFQQTANFTRGCTEMAITMAIGVRNVCLRRRRKTEQVIFRCCIKTLASFTHLEAQKPDQAPV
jgi:hypothetical protein